MNLRHKIAAILASAGLLATAGAAAMPTQANAAPTNGGEIHAQEIAAVKHSTKSDRRLMHMATLPDGRGKETWVIRGQWSNDNRDGSSIMYVGSIRVPAGCALWLKPQGLLYGRWGGKERDHSRWVNIGLPAGWAVAKFVC